MVKQWQWQKSWWKKSVSFHLLNSPSWMLCLRFVSPGVARSCGDKVLLISLKYMFPVPIFLHMTWHAPRVTSCYKSPLSSSPGLEELVQGEGKYEGNDGGKGGPDEEGAFVKVLRLGPQKDVSRCGSNVLAAASTFHDHLGKFQVRSSSLPPPISPQQLSQTQWWRLTKHWEQAGLLNQKSLIFYARNLIYSLISKKCSLKCFFWHYF